MQCNKTVISPPRYTHTYRGGLIGYGVGVNVRVLLGILVRDGVLVRVLVPVREGVGVKVFVAVAVSVRVLSGVKVAVRWRVVEGVWVISGVLVDVRDVITLARLTPATKMRPSRKPTTEFWLAESTDTAPPL